MSYKLYDRLLRQFATKIPEGALTARYQIVGQSPVFVNSIPAQREDFLVPDRQGAWSIRAESGAILTEGIVPSEKWLPEREQESLRDFGTTLQRLLQSQATWNEWVQASTLVLGFIEKAQPQPLERAVKEYLHHLQAVAQRPHMHLRIETEPMPVARARRVPLQAIEHLAAHTEDWQHRSIRSVIPKRILAVFYDDQLNIYENRVAARLIDNLGIYLHDRLSQLQKLYHDIEVDREAGTYGRQKRVYELIGGAVDERIYGNQISRTMEMVQFLHSTVLDLHDSQLYKAIPRQQQVGRSVRNTNIFASDKHYRFVALLWRRWLEHAQDRSTSAAEDFRRIQDICRGFDSYCMLLVIRALDQLKYEPRNLLATMSPGSALQLVKKRGQEGLVLDWRHDRTISIQSAWEDKSRSGGLEIIPLASALTASGDGNRIRDQLNRIRAELLARQSQDRAEPSGYRLVLYPGDSTERARLPGIVHLSSKSLGNDLLKPMLVGLLPVSTYEVESVERVGRAIRWATLGQQLSSYPPVLRVPPFVEQQLVPDSKRWLTMLRTGEVAVMRPPREDEVRKFRDLIDKERRSLISKGKSTRATVDLLTEFEEQLKVATSRLNTLLYCPLCDEQNSDRALDVSQKSLIFKCVCVSCNCVWGTRICEKCNHRYPYLQPQDAESTLQDGERSPGWVDRLVGMDVLSIPCWLTDSRGDYICPNCGMCPNIRLGIGDDCARCQSSS